MTIDWKKFLTIVGIGLVAGFVLRFITRSPVVFAGYLLLLVIIAFFASMGKPKKRERPRKRTRAIPKEPTQMEAMLLGLVKLNIKVRTDLPRELTEKCEQIIDKLRRLLPEINARYPNSELTLMVNATAKSYLPDLVNEYADLNEGARASRQQGLIESLGMLSGKLAEIARMVHEKEESEFDSQAKFLKAKFFNNIDTQ